MDHVSFTTKLGVHGYGRLEPVLLAALAGEEPLLLIGDHGTAKSMLLERIAVAMGLSWRHYNASLLNFDDLIGFPVPDGTGGLQYLHTPSSVWDCEAVFIDEIGRCRPDMQNRLFSIIHEKRLQGMALGKLRFRWAAMNPPGGGGEDSYFGNEPLDGALADRFQYVIRVPNWGKLSDADRNRILRTCDSDADAGEVLRKLVAAARSEVESSRGKLDALAGEYVLALSGLLAKARLQISPRRARMLYRSVISIHAAMTALGEGDDIERAFWLATSQGLPFAASREQVSGTKILAAHRDAWRLVSVQPGDPLKAVLLESDPIRRVMAAASLPRSHDVHMGRIVTDAMAAAEAGAREALAVHVFESGLIARVEAAVAEDVGAVCADITRIYEFSEKTRAGRPRNLVWERVTAVIEGLDAASEADQRASNVLARCFRQNRLPESDAVDACLAAYRSTKAALDGGANAF